MLMSSRFCQCQRRPRAPSSTSESDVALEFAGNGEPTRRPQTNGSSCEQTARILSRAYTSRGLDSDVDAGDLPQQDYVCDRRSARAEASCRLEIIRLRITRCAGHLAQPPALEVAAFDDDFQHGTLGCASHGCHALRHRFELPRKCETDGDDHVDLFGAMLKRPGRLVSVTGLRVSPQRKANDGHYPHGAVLEQRRCARHVYRVYANASKAMLPSFLTQLFDVCRRHFGLQPRVFDRA